MNVIQWIVDHFALILTALLVVSESLAALAQLLFPANKGFSGFLAGLIKVLQNLGAKAPAKVE